MKSSKKELAIVFGITNNLTSALATVLIGIKKHFSLKEFDIIVYHDGIDKENQTALNTILPCEFIKYENKINKDILDKDCLNLYSNMCLCRFECFDLLHKYKKVIWHDVDILIQKDFKDLLKYGDKTGLAMTYSDINFMVESNFTEPIENYNMFLTTLNSGLIVFSDKLKRYDEMTAWCYEKLKELNKKIRYLDQGVLNLLVQDFDISVESIDIKEYCCHPARSGSKNATIVHSYGYDKFWNAFYLLQKFPEWWEDITEWGKIKRKLYNEKNTKEIPEVSVIMSLYNRTDYIKPAIESILNQTFTNFEFIIVVEKSDSQNEIIEELKKIDDKRIVIIANKEKLGFSESLNVGIKRAVGKYIARMDDDDISMPMRFERQLEYFSKNPEISILGTAVYQFMNDERQVYPLTTHEQIKTYSLVNNQMYHPTIMMKRADIMKYNLFYDKDYKTEDAELWSRALQKVKMANMREIQLCYRASNLNETVLSKKAVFDSDIRIIQKQIKENLKLDISLDEAVYLSGRIGQNVYIYNRKQILDKKKAIAKKVYKQNKKVGYYDKKLLSQVLELAHDNFIKRTIKWMIRPIYNRLMSRVETLIYNKIWETKND